MQIDRAKLTFTLELCVRYALSCRVCNSQNTICAAISGGMEKQMKKQYEQPVIELVLIDQCDIITTSGGDGVIDGNGPIGGNGYDAGGWT